MPHKDPDQNRKYKRERNAERYKTDPEYRERRLAAQRRWRERNIEQVRAYGRAYSQEHVTESNARQKVRRSKNPEFYLWQGAKGRARRNGILFNITPEDIVIPEKCPVFGVPLEFNFDGRRGGHAVNHSPSLDRIRPELGYVRGNIQVLSGRANTIKNSASPEELRLFALWVLGDASLSPSGTCTCRVGDERLRDRGRKRARRSGDCQRRRVTTPTISADGTALLT